MPISTRSWVLPALAALLILVVQPGSSASIAHGNSFLTRAEKFYPRRLQSFYRRDNFESNVFHPRSTVVVEYDYGVPSSPMAVVSFDASGTHPIVVIGAFDELLQSTKCTPSSVPITSGSGSSVIDLQFRDTDSASEAANTWNKYQRLHFVTSHASCNLDSELGAWRVHGIEADLMTQRIRLLAESIPLHELGSYNVALSGHSMAGVWKPQIIRNKFSRRRIFESAFNKDFSGTDILSGDVSLDLPPALATQLQTANLNIQCVECTVNFNFTVDVNVTLSNLNITAMSITTTVNSFDQSILLGVSTGGGGLSFSHDRDLFNLPLTDIAIRDLVNIGPEVGVSASLELDLSGEVNFTMGAKASIDSGTFASFDFLKQKESDQGWDTATFSSIPLKLQSGSLNSTLTMTISPFIGIGVTPPINNDKPLVEARISQNAPSIVFAANITNNVNRNCEPVGDNDFESFPTAYQLSADMTFATHVGLVGDVADVLPQWDQEFPHGDFQFFNHTGVGQGSSCFVVVDDSSTATTTSASALLTAAPTGTLLAAASAVPSFDVSKIESYFSANNGQLPTNVNYAQLVQATTVPDDIKNAVQKAAHQGKSAASKTSSSGVYSFIMTFMVYILL